MKLEKEQEKARLKIQRLEEVKNKILKHEQMHSQNSGTSHQVLNGEVINETEKDVKKRDPETTQQTLISSFIRNDNPKIHPKKIIKQVEPDQVKPKTGI